MRCRILGCGASTGVPMLGCNCAVCTSSNPRNHRLRASVLISNDDGSSSVLVDASPDLRAQALAANIITIDGLIITHAHADHCHGMDDVRSFNYHRDAAVPLYAEAETMDELMRRFAYIFKPHQAGFGWYKPAFDTHVITLDAVDSTMMSIGGHDMVLFRQWHGKGKTIGIRCGNFAYSTDVNRFDAHVSNCLEGLDVWVVDCLRYAVAPTHAHLEMTLEWINTYKPKRAILTHMGHDFDYDNPPTLPDSVELAYDGMEIRW